MLYVVLSFLSFALGVRSGCSLQSCKDLHLDFYLLSLLLESGQFFPEFFSCNTLTTNTHTTNALIFKTSFPRATGILGIPI